MGIILDIIILGLLILAGYLGYRDGALKVVLDFVVILLVMLIVFFVYKPVADLVINNTNLYKSIKTSIYTNLEKNNVNEETKFELKGFPALEKNINNILREVKEKQYQDFRQEVAERLSITVTRAIVAITLSIVVYLILTIIKITLIKLVDVIPIVSTVNNIAGSIIQILKILVIIYIILYILQFVLPLLNNSGLQENINKTMMLKYMYNNNLVNVLLNK